MKNDEWLKHLTDTLNENEICPHCKMDLKIRNPSGFCDHLYYPDNCVVCKVAERLK